MTAGERSGPGPGQKAHPAEAGRPIAPAAPLPAVVIVDDEPDFLDGTLRALRKAPYRFRTARSAEEALALLAAEPADVLVTDLQMPGTSGLELLRVCAERHPATVRIALTGHPGTSSAIQAINEGRVFQYLTKPYGPGELLEVLGAACAAGRAERERERLAARARAEEARRGPMDQVLLTPEEREALRGVLGGAGDGEGGGGAGGRP